MKMNSLKSFVEICYTHHVDAERISIKTSAGGVLSFDVSTADRFRVVRTFNEQKHWEVIRQVPYKLLDLVRITIRRI